MTISPQRRTDIIDALRAGAVPTRGLDTLAVGLGRFEAAIGEELEKVKGGGSVFKAVRGEYGGGKTFFARWLQERAKRLGFATAEVQISETETPLHRLVLQSRRRCFGDRRGGRQRCRSTARRNREVDGTTARRHRTALTHVRPGLTSLSKSVRRRRQRCGRVHPCLGRRAAQR
jgi:P-loop Domain of unknown function (DUF2791)